MFKGKPTVYMAIVSLVVGLCTCFATDKDVRLEEMKNYQKYKDILLDSSEVPNVRKEKVNSSSWVIRMGPKGEPLSEAGFVQVFEVENSPAMAILQYGRFADTNTAEEALAFVLSNSPEPFQSEPWPEAHLIDMPDQIWFSINRSTSMIVFRYGSTCVSAASVKGSAVEKRKQTVFFADKVMSRLRRDKGEEKEPSVVSVVAETNTPTPVKKEPPIRSVETTPEPVPEPESPAPSSKSAKHTSKMVPWLLLLCIGGLASLGWRIAHKKRVANKG